MSMINDNIEANFGPVIKGDSTLLPAPPMMQGVHLDEFGVGIGIVFRQVRRLACQVNCTSVTLAAVPKWPLMTTRSWLSATRLSQSVKLAGMQSKITVSFHRSGVEYLTQFINHSLLVFPRS